MTIKLLITLLCIGLLLVCAIAIALALFAWYLVGRSNRYELQSERKTELLLILNNRHEELQKQYDELEKEVLQHDNR